MNTISVLIDSHCHLDFSVFDDHRDELIHACEKAGFSMIVNPAVGVANWDKIEQIVSRYPIVQPAYGLHPVFLDLHQEAHLDLLESQLLSKPCVAVGEIGLDYFESNLCKERQQSLFEAQVALAERVKLPVILHVRKAHDETLSTLKRLGFSQGGIVHAFSGSEQQAKKWIDSGFVLGFGGTMTYDRAKKIRHLAKTLPLCDLVLETDAPDMPPSSIQKGQNSPINLVEIAQTLADIRSQSVTTIRQVCADNTRRILRVS